tara:strand:+ start:1551 stop:1838 length:288 start_codon:yes stop_codon:yes gene_type:complete
MLNIFIVTVIIILSLFLSYYIFRRIRDYYRYWDTKDYGSSKKKGKKDRETINRERQIRLDNLYEQLDEWNEGEWKVIVPEYRLDESTGIISFSSY